VNAYGKPRTVRPANRFGAEEWLRQALDLLGGIDDEAYLESPPALAPHKVSGHMRHMIEFYECFLEALDSCHVDYDSRRRDQTIEASRAVAMDRISALIDRLEFEPALRGDGAVFVRMEDASALDIAEPFLLSSVGRELQVLSSHTIHHFALIAMTLNAHGSTVAGDFGVAPSTLRFRKRDEALMVAAA
jgi:hypothetical protein